MSAPHYASDPSEIMPRSDVLKMSGLDYLTGIVAGRIASPPIANTLNYRFIHAEEGRVICRGTPEFAAFNLHGTPHGGWYATVLDSGRMTGVASAEMRGVSDGKLYATGSTTCIVLKA